MTDSFQLPSGLLCSSHPQLVKSIVHLRGYQGLKTCGGRLLKKKSAREERSISLALGGARSSTPSLHHPGAGGVTAHGPGSLSQLATGFKSDNPDT
jgi:hypothetical protein